MLAWPSGYSSKILGNTGGSGLHLDFLKEYSSIALSGRKGSPGLEMVVLYFDGVINRVTDRMHECKSPSAPLMS